jgi:hypothetical protein
VDVDDSAELDLRANEVDRIVELRGGGGGQVKDGNRAICDRAKGPALREFSGQIEHGRDALINRLLRFGIGKFSPDP